MRELAWERVGESASIEDTASLASSLAQVLEDGDCVALIGGLGAGKTSFVQALAKRIGVASVVNSPTYNIVNEYLDGAYPIRHFDLYRLEDATDLEDVGFYEATDESNPGISIVEWADLFLDEMPDDALFVKILLDDEGSIEQDDHVPTRLFFAASPSDEAHQLLDAWRGAHASDGLAKDVQ